MKPGAFCCQPVVTVVCIKPKIQYLNICTFHIPSFVPLYAKHKFCLPEIVPGRTLLMTAKRLANGSGLQRNCKRVKHLHPKQFKQELLCPCSIYLYDRKKNFNPRRAWNQGISGLRTVEPMQKTNIFHFRYLQFTE